MDKKKKIIFVISIMFVFGIFLCGTIIYGSDIIDYIIFLISLTIITLAVVAYFKNHGLGNGIKRILIELLKGIAAFALICIGIFFVLFLFYKLGWLGDLSLFF